MMMLFIEVQTVVKAQTNDNFLVGLTTTAYHLPFFLFGLLFGRLGDFIRRRMIIFTGCLVAGAGALMMGLFIKSYPAVLVGRELSGLGMGMLPGALFASTVERRASVGTFAAMGALGWTLGSFLGPGLGPRPLTFFVAAAMAALPAVLGFSFRRLPVRPRTRFLSLRAVRKHWPVFLGVFLRHTGAMSIWVTFTLFLKERGAYGALIPGVKILDMTGLIYAINPLAQFFFMLIIHRLKPRVVLPLGYILSIIVFLGYIAAPSPWFFLPLQVLLGFSWAALYLGSLVYLTRRSEERSTVSGTFNALFGLCGITGSLLGGRLSSISYELAMLVAAGMAFVGLVVVVCGERDLFRTSETNEATR